MPLPKQPKGLLDICVEYAAVNIDDILKYEEQAELSGFQLKINYNKLRKSALDLVLYCIVTSFSLHQLILDDILWIGQLHDDNYRKVLNSSIRNLLLRKESCKITKLVEFVEFLQEHCKNIKQIDLVPILDDPCFIGSCVEKSIMIGNALASMEHLEWVNLQKCGITDQCLMLIGSKCQNMKHLNLRLSDNITNEGIRALYDPSIITPLGLYEKCNQLTHLFLTCTTFYWRMRPQVTPELVSQVLLHCPNLEYLDYRFSAKAVAEAIATVDEQFAKLWYNNDADEVVSRFDKLSCSPKPEFKGFKLKTIEFCCNTAPVFAESICQMLTHYTPQLEHLIVEFPADSASGNLRALSTMKLKSVTVVQHDIGRPPLSHEFYLLMHFTGLSINTLAFWNLTEVDLGVIQSVCPNLTTLYLISCDTSTSTGNNVSPAHSTFGSLKTLKVKRTTFSSGDFAELLCSPNLERLELESLTIGTIRILQQVLLDCPHAFQKLKFVHFVSVQMDKLNLRCFINRALVLNHLAVSHCFDIIGEKWTLFDEKLYFDRLVEALNWDLKCVWSGFTKKYENHIDFQLPYLL